MHNAGITELIGEEGTWRAERINEVPSAVDQI
jgi:hypothetical protein